ncbi:MAG TPA: DUF4238 domain-containing protein [Longimicrobium sp.]|nr:DUF4238 domain-containing protein [Longimicrobium sp.]
MTKKRHHAVPQFYLRRFTDSAGLLWLHDLDNATAVQVRPSDALVEKYLYSPETGANPHDDTLEEFFAVHVEGPAAPALDTLARGAELPDEDRQRVAVFLAFQEIRVPRWRDLVTDFASKIGDRILKMSAARPEYMRRVFDEMGEEVSDEDLTRMIEGIESGGLSVEATKAAWFQSMHVASETAQMLYRMPWTVVEASRDVEFVTSDAPIAKVLTDRSVPPMYAGGWLSPSAESTFVLDPRCCLVIRPDGTEGRIAGPKAWCKNVNTRLIWQANRFVVSRARETFVETVARKRRAAGTMS